MGIDVGGSTLMKKYLLGPKLGDELGLSLEFSNSRRLEVKLTDEEPSKAYTLRLKTCIANSTIKKSITSIAALICDIKYEVHTAIGEVEIEMVNFKYHLL